MATKTDGGFAARVNYAVRVISAGSKTSRGFDNCFESCDGDAVAVAVYRRSLKNPALAANIWRYLGRESVMECVEKLAHVTNMTEEAARQRAASRAKWDEAHRRQAERQAETTTNQGSLI